MPIRSGFFTRHPTGLPRACSSLNTSARSLSVDVSSTAVAEASRSTSSPTTSTASAVADDALNCRLAICWPSLRVTPETSATAKIVRVTHPARREAPRAIAERNVDPQTGGCLLFVYSSSCKKDEIWPIIWAFCSSVAPSHMSLCIVAGSWTTFIPSFACSSGGGMTPSSAT